MMAVLLPNPRIACRNDAVAELSVLVTLLLLRHLKVFDVPNERSSHARATPRGGGIAIVTAFLVGISLIQLIGDKTPIYAPYFLSFEVGGMP